MIVVRTQDKLTLVQPGVVEVNGCTVRAAWLDCDGTLGVYDTPERAVEVVDLMHRFLNGAELQHVQRVFQMPER